MALNDFHSYWHYAGLDETQSPSRRPRQINDPTFYERTAVVDLHFDGAAVFQVRHPGLASQWKRLMRCRQLGLIVDLAARGFFAVKTRTVPGGLAAQRMLRCRLGSSSKTYILRSRLAVR